MGNLPRSPLSPSETTTTSATEATTTTTTTTTTTEAPTTISTTTTTSMPPFVHCTADPGCGICSNVTLNGGTIRSSNYPNDNQDNLNCKIVIEAAPNAKVLLTFTEFVVEEDYDFVMVYDSSYRMLREELTGYNIPSPFNVKSNNVTINFQTDKNNWSLLYFGNDNSGRWAVDFTIIYPTAAVIQDDTKDSTTSTVFYSGYSCTTECGVCRSISENTGIIQSPNYSADYGNNRNCKITIDTGSLRSKITLDFIEFNVEQDYDFISVFDANQKEFRNMTGYTLLDLIVLKTTQLVIQFHSDENNLGIFSNFPGSWKASFKVHPLTTTTTSTEPATTTPITEATTTQPTTTSNEAPTTTTQKPTTATTTTTTPTTPTTLTKTTTQTTQTTTVNPYMPKCTTVPTEYEYICKNISLSGGIIESPNYSNENGTNRNAVVLVVIEVINYRIIKLNLDVVVLEPNMDYIWIYDGGSTTFLQLASLGGYSTPQYPPYYTTSYKMLIQFSSNVGNGGIPLSYGPGRWNGTFTTVDPNMPRCYLTTGYEYPCQNINLSGGIIESPNYPNDYGTYYEPNIDSINLYDGVNGLALPYGLALTGYSTPKYPSYYTTSNKMWIDFYSNVGNANIPSNLQPGRWNGSFSVLHPNTPRCRSITPLSEYLCKNISLSGGTAESPNYPNDYGTNSNFRFLFTIQVPTGKKISLTFEVFVLEPNTDTITIYDGGNVGTPKLASGWTGYSTTRPPITGTSNQILIDFTCYFGNINSIPASYGQRR